MVLPIYYIFIYFYTYCSEKIVISYREPKKFTARDCIPISNKIYFDYLLIPTSEIYNLSGGINILTHLLLEPT